MKAYVCDACGETIKDPYSMRMKEFCIGVECSIGYCLPVKEKRKVKVHLCAECYEGLYEIAKCVKESNDVEIH